MFAHRADVIKRRRNRLHLAPRRSGVLRALGGLIDYAVGEPLHFAMTRRMMLGLKERAEGSARAGARIR